jgi:hypothetical protein
VIGASPQHAIRHLAGVDIGMRIDSTTWSVARWIAPHRDSGPSMRA